MRSNRIVRRSVFILLALTLVFAGVTAWGQMPPRGGMQQRCQEQFKTIDKNQNGMVDLQEFSSIPHRQANPETVFKARDTNADGNLTAEEFCAGPRK